MSVNLASANLFAHFFWNAGDKTDIFSPVEKGGPVVLASQVSGHVQSRLNTPWEAVLLSVLMPGAGQFLAGRALRGLFWLLLLLAGVLLFLWLLITPWLPSCWPALICAMVVVLLWIVMVGDAYRVTPHRSGPFRPVLVAALSWILPGLGQLMNRRWTRGVALVLLPLILFLLHSVMHLRITNSMLWLIAVHWGLMSVVKWWAICDAYRDAALRSGAAHPITPALAATFGGHLGLILLLVTLEVTSFDVRTVVTPSMEPTLQGGVTRLDRSVLRPGDEVIVDRIIYRWRTPQRGEVVAYRMAGSLTRTKTVDMLRVAGLPWERISLEPPYLRVNGNRLLAPGIFKRIAEQDGPGGGYRFVLLQAGKVRLHRTDDVIRLTAGEYFLVGDSPAKSFDSRLWGPVQRDQIEGRVTKIFRPLARTGNSLAP